MYNSFIHHDKAAFDNGANCDAPSSFPHHSSPEKCFSQQRLRRLELEYMLMIEIQAPIQWVSGFLTSIVKQPGPLTSI
jgi:hypothetical protein